MAVAAQLELMRMQAEEGTQLAFMALVEEITPRPRLWWQQKPLGD